MDECVSIVDKLKTKTFVVLSICDVLNGASYLKRYASNVILDLILNTYMSVCVFNARFVKNFNTVKIYNNQHLHHGF